MWDIGQDPLLLQGSKVPRVTERSPGHWKGPRGHWKVPRGHWKSPGSLKGPQGHWKDHTLMSKLILMTQNIYTFTLLTYCTQTCQNDNLFMLKYVLWFYIHLACWSSYIHLITLSNRTFLLNDLFPSSIHKRWLVISPPTSLVVWF